MGRQTKKYFLGAEAVYTSEGYRDTSTRDVFHEDGSRTREESLKPTKYYITKSHPSQTCDQSWWTPEETAYEPWREVTEEEAKEWMRTCWSKL